MKNDGSRRKAFALSCVAGVGLAATSCDASGGGSAPKDASVNRPRGALDGAVLTIAPAADSTGDFYIGGSFTDFRGRVANRILRLEETGHESTRFSAGSGFGDVVTAIAPVEDGSGGLYVGGCFRSYDGVAARGLVRLFEDGGVDPRFRTGAGIAGSVHALALAADGSGDVYVGGDFWRYDGEPCGGLLRLHPDGTVDASFSVGSFDGPVTAIAPVEDGSGAVYVGGLYSAYDGVPAGGIVLLDAFGAVDRRFVSGPGFDGMVTSIVPALDRSGDLYFGGLFTEYSGVRSPGIARIDSSGGIDHGFSVGGGFDGMVAALAVASDGSGDVYACGAFESFDGFPSPGVVRLTSRGKIESVFRVGNGFDRTVNAIALARDGSELAYLGGDFGWYGARRAGRLIALDREGDVCHALDLPSGEGFDRNVRDVAPACDGSGDIYLSGSFTAYDGLPAGRIVRIDSDGSWTRGLRRAQASRESSGTSNPSRTVPEPCTQEAGSSPTTATRRAGSSGSSRPASSMQASTLERGSRHPISRVPSGASWLRAMAADGSMSAGCSRPTTRFPLALSCGWDAMVGWTAASRLGPGSKGA